MYGGVLKETSPLKNKIMRKYKHDLKNYSTKELNTILTQINEMLIIPIHNVFNLNNEQLKQMQTQLETEIKNR